VVKGHRFSLRSLTLSSAVWYVSVVSGWALIAFAIYRLATVSTIDRAASFWISAALLVTLELLPLMQGRGHDPQGVVMSTAFVCGMMFMWGPWPAIVSVAIASLASDLRARKSWWKTLFNPAQYALSVGVAGLIIVAFGHTASLDHSLATLNFDDLFWMAGVWVTYFVVNLAIVAGVLSFAASFWDVVAEDLVNSATMSFAVMSLSPLIVLVSQRASGLLPLLLVPLLLLYYTAITSLEREHAAGHDTLTGLPNRATLRFELDEALNTFRRDGTPFGLLLIDMDNFKVVNDTLGHQVGDQLLTRFAARLRERVRSGDLVARLGGDEFAVIVYDADGTNTRQIADDLRNSFTDPIDLDGFTIEVEASIGIAVCPDHGRDGTTLLQRADVAMYSAKEGGTRTEVYAPERDSNSADRLGLLGELRQALIDDELELYYQPKVSTRERTPIGVEALVRWRHPLRGFVPPDQFIPLAERSGIMPLLTERVVNLAVRQAALWRDAGIAVPIAVNVAPNDLSSDDLSAVLARCLIEHKLDPGMLKLEITERVATNQVDATQTNLDQLRDMGVEISLDDFGTGYSSLLRLSSLHVDEIKIDRGFIAAMSEGERAVNIVRTMIDLAHGLGTLAIAEGVETAGELAILAELGCDGVQGWHIARPMAARDATEWLRERLPLPIDIVRSDSVSVVSHLRAV
jgi:diguanylate cyclase (GGDEF)-like protein